MIRNYKYWATARLTPEGEVEARISGSAEYGTDDRTVTASLDTLPAEELAAVQKALQKLVDSHQEEIAQATTLAAASALTVAAQFQEIGKARPDAVYVEPGYQGRVTAEGMVDEPKAARKTAKRGAK